MNSTRIVAVPGYRMEWAAGNWRPFVFLVGRQGAPEASNSIRGMPGVALLWRVFEVADVHVASRSDRGHAAPRGFVGAPHIKEERSRCTGHSQCVRNHQLAVDVPVDMSRGPHNLEVVTVSLMESGNLGVLEV